MNSVALQAGNKFFHGWWIVLVAAIGLSMGYVPFIGFTFSVFFNPLSQQFGWSRSEISLAFSLSLLALSVTLPLSGRITDRVGARKVIVPAALLFGLGLASFYYLSDNLWHFYTVYLFLGIVGSGTLATPYFKVISQWFNRKRGLALGLTTVGTGMGAFFMPFLAHTLIATVGWRIAYLLIGSMVIVVVAPVVGLCLKEKPAMLGFAPDGEGTSSGSPDGLSEEQHGMTCREAWRTGSFWLMAAAFFLLSLSLNGCLIHIVPMLTDRGASVQKAALATSLLGSATLLGRVGTGYLLDRFVATRVAISLFCGAALGVLLLWANVTVLLTFLAAFLVGLGIGAEGDIMAYLVSRYFGLRAFGEIYGYILTIYTLGAMIGPLLLAAGFDSTGSYKVILGPFLLATLLAAGLMALLGPYQLGERVATPATD